MVVERIERIFPSERYLMRGTSERYLAIEAEGAGAPPRSASRLRVRLTDTAESPARGDVVAVRFRPTGADLRRFAIAAAALAAGMLLVVNAAFLFERTFEPLSAYPMRSGAFRALAASVLGRVPLPLPYPYVKGLDWVLFKERDGVGYIWLLGELRGGKGFFGYFFWVFLLKVPLGAQVLMVAALVAYLTGSRRPRLIRGHLVNVEDEGADGRDVLDRAPGSRELGRGPAGPVLEVSHGSLIEQVGQGDPVYREGLGHGVCRAVEQGYDHAPGQNPTRSTRGGT